MPHLPLLATVFIVDNSMCNSGVRVCVNDFIILLRCVSNYINTTGDLIVKILGNGLTGSFGIQDV